MSVIESGMGAIRAGDLIFVRGSTPAAGSEARLVAPSNYAYEIFFFYTKLNTSAAAATRRFRAEITDGVDTARIALFNQDITASLSWDITCVPRFGSQVILSGVSDAMVPMAPVILIPGMTLQTRTSQLQAGDQYEAIKALVRLLQLTRADEGMLPPLSTF